MPKKTTLNVYNLAEIGVDVDTDNVHAPVGGFRLAQNIHRNPTQTAAASIITRQGMRKLNSAALGSGPILGGTIIPVFEAGDGVATLFLGFGD